MFGAADIRDSIGERMHVCAQRWRDNPPSLGTPSLRSSHGYSMTSVAWSAYRPRSPRSPPLHPADLPDLQALVAGFLFAGRTVWGAAWQHDPLVLAARVATQSCGPTAVSCWACWSTAVRACATADRAMGPTTGFAGRARPPRNRPVRRPGPGPPHQPRKSGYGSDGWKKLGAGRSSPGMGVPGLWIPVVGTPEPVSQTWMSQERG